MASSAAPTPIVLDTKLPKVGTTIFTVVCGRWYWKEVLFILFFLLFFIFIVCFCYVLFLLLLDFVLPLPEPPLCQMSALATEHGAVNMGQGFPDFQPPAFLVDELARAMREGKNQYAPMTGLPSLRQAIASACSAGRRGRLFYCSFIF